MANRKPIQNEPTQNNKKKNPTSPSLEWKIITSSNYYNSKAEENE